MWESHPHSWRLARALLSKQLQVSWCGLSFPLSWPRYGMGVWRSVGKASVKEKRGSVYLSLLVGHDFPFDLSADQLFYRPASSRSYRVTMSATKGPAWNFDNTCQVKSASSAMQAGAGKISFYAAAKRLDLYHTVNEWQIISKHTHARCSVSWQLCSSANQALFILNSNQRIKQS